MNILGSIFSTEGDQLAVRNPFDCIKLLRSSSELQQLSALSYVEDYIRIKDYPRPVSSSSAATATARVAPLPPFDVTKCIVDSGMTSENSVVRQRAFAIMAHLYRHNGRSAAAGLHFDEVKRAITTELSAYENIKSTFEALELLNEFCDSDIVSFCMSSEGQSATEAACSSSNNDSNIRASMISGLGRVLVRSWCLIMTGDDSKTTANGSPYGVSVASLASGPSGDDAAKARDDFVDFALEWLGGLCSETAGTGPKVTLEGLPVAEPTPSVLNAIYGIVAFIFDVYWVSFDAVGSYGRALCGASGNPSSRIGALLRASSAHLLPLLETCRRTLFDDPHMLFSRWSQNVNYTPYGVCDHNACGRQRAAIERVGSALCKLALLDTSSSKSLDYEFGSKPQVFSFDKYIDESRGSRFNGNKGLGRNKVGLVSFCSDWVQYCLLPQITHSSSIEASVGTLVDCVDLLQFRALHDLRGSLAEEILFAGIRLLNRCRITDKTAVGSATGERIYITVMTRLYVVLRVTLHTSRPSYLLALVPHLVALGSPMSIVGCKMIAEFATMLFVSSTSIGDSGDSALVTGSGYIRRVLKSILEAGDSSSSEFKYCLTASICTLLRELINRSLEYHRQTSTGGSVAVLASQLCCACAAIPILHSWLREQGSGASSTACAPMLFMVAVCDSALLQRLEDPVFATINSAFVAEAVSMAEQCLHDSVASPVFRIDTFVALVHALPRMPADPGNTATSVEKYIFCAFNLMRAEIDLEVSSPADTADVSSKISAPLSAVIVGRSRQYLLVCLGCNFVDRVMCLLVRGTQDFLYSACTEFVDSIHTTISSRLLLDSKQTLVEMKKRLKRYAGQWVNNSSGADGGAPAQYSSNIWLYNRPGSGLGLGFPCTPDVLAVVADVVSASVVALMPPLPLEVGARAIDDSAIAHSHTIAENDYIWHELSGASDVLGLFACETISQVDCVATIFVRIYNNTTFKLPPYSVQFTIYSKGCTKSSGRRAALFPGREYTATIEEYTLPQKSALFCFQFGLLELCAPTYALTVRFSGLERDVTKQFIVPSPSSAVPVASAAVDGGSVGTLNTMSVALSSSARALPITSQIRPYLRGACSSMAAFARLATSPLPNPIYSPFPSGIPIDVFCAQRDRLKIVKIFPCICDEANVFDAVFRAVGAVQGSGQRVHSGGAFYLGAESMVTPPPGYTSILLAWCLETIYCSSSDSSAGIAVALKNSSPPVSDVGGGGWRGIVEICCGSGDVADTIENDIESFVHHISAGSIAICSSSQRAAEGSSVLNGPVVKTTYNTDIFKKKDAPFSIKRK